MRSGNSIGWVIGIFLVLSFAFWMTFFSQPQEDIEKKAFREGYNVGILIGKSLPLWEEPPHKMERWNAMRDSSFALYQRTQNNDSSLLSFRYVALERAREIWSSKSITPP